MGKKYDFFKHFISNKLKICEFAITNVCTAKCHFCSIWQQKEKHIVDLEKALKTITHLSKLGIRLVVLTGGEPLIHKHFDKILTQCTHENITSSILNADARLFTGDRLDALEKSKVDLVCISIDHHINEIASEARTIPDLLTSIEKAVNGLKERNITTMASTLICNYNHKSLGELFKKCRDIGFDLISVNYPEFSKSSVYTLGGNAIDLSREELITALNTVIKLKKEYKNIINPVDSIENIISFLENKTPKFMCLGGYRAIFIDWFFKVYPCMYLDRNMGDVLELRKEDFKKVPCNQCNMSWYRDFSIYFQGLRSLKPIVLSAIPFYLGFQSK